MRTIWVVTEKTDHVSRTGSKIKARLSTMSNSSEEFSKDSIQFESPTCGRDTVKAIFSLEIGMTGLVTRCVGLGCTIAPGDPAAYSYDRDGARGSLAIHLADALTAGNAEFYDKFIVPLPVSFPSPK